MPILTPGRVRHGVVYSLKHAEGSPEEADFLKANAALASIPGVEAFELMREVSPKNDYRFALTMEFADRAAYDAYDAHPDHQRFVGERWGAEVAEFLEVDTAPR
jgi:heme-degrading monooxygenase HmoA